MRRRPAIFGTLLLLVGGALFLKGLWDWREDAWILWNGKEAEGAIVERRELAGEGGKPAYELVVDLTIGTEIQRRTFAVPRPMYERESSRVTARYLAEDPGRLRLSGEVTQPNDALVLGLMVVVLGGLICGIHVLRRRQAQALEEAIPESPAGSDTDSGGETR